MSLLGRRAGPILLAVAWYLYATDVLAGDGRLACVAVGVGAIGAVWDVGARRGYFHPLSIYLFFAGAVAFYGAVWMVLGLNHSVEFFGYPLYVEPRHLRALASEQLLLTTVTYVVARIAGAGRKDQQRDLGPLIAGTRRMVHFWYLPYAVGLAALLYFLEVSGGVGYVLAHLADRGDRAAGRGPLIVLQYFLFPGALLWFLKSLKKNAIYRYGTALALGAPILLAGARHDFLILIIALLYLDERAGWRPPLWVVIGGGLSVTYLSTLYQAFRASATVTDLTTLDVLQGAYRDLSMPVGYVVARSYGFLKGQGNLHALALTFGPFLPDAIKSAIESPNHAFTQSFFPGTPSTYSFGVWGEANFIAPQGFSFLYYGFLAFLLSVVDRAKGPLGALVAAIAAGVAIRFVKGGLTQGGANMLMWVVPMVMTYVALAWLGAVYLRRTRSPLAGSNARGWRGDTAGPREKTAATSTSGDVPRPERLG